MPRPSSRFPISGFTLVDLIITVMLLVSLAGIGGFYYQEFKDSQRTGVATNELDALAKAVQAYELTTSSAVDDRLVSHFTSQGFPPLHFLVEAGSLPSIPSDPWGRNYQIDPSLGIVYSMGPKGPAEGDLSGTDDIKRLYKKGGAKAAGATGALWRGVGNKDKEWLDKQPPVITVVEPVGTLVLGNPPVRCVYYDNPGGSIAVSDSVPKKPKLYIDGKDADDLVQAGLGQLNRSSSEMVYRTSGLFSETEHLVVAQVEDGSGNVARRQWKFSVEIPRVTVSWLEPTACVRGSVNITAAIYNGGSAIRRWSLFMSGLGQPTFELASGITYSRAPGEPVTLLSGLDTKTKMPDGTYTLKLLVTTLTGYVYPSDREFVVDNTPPEISRLSPAISRTLNQSPPGGPSCSQAQVITTAVPDLGGEARDPASGCSSIKNVKYQYYSANPSDGSTIEAILPASEIAYPPDWTPSRGREELFDTSLETFYTTPHPASREGFEPPPLEAGLYKVGFQATDLAGNVSTERTTCFWIELTKPRICKQFLLDGTPCITACYLPCPPNGNPPYQEHLWHLRGYSPGDEMSAQPLAETSGRVQFQLCEAPSSPIATWQVIVDDNGLGGRPDGLYNSQGLTRDWTDIGSVPGGPLTTESGWYQPNDPTNSLRRGGGTAASYIESGVLSALIKYSSRNSPQPATAITTFLLDNQPPSTEWQSPKLRKNEFYIQECQSNGQLTPTYRPLIVNSEVVHLPVPTGCPPKQQIALGGLWFDEPEIGLVRTVDWHVSRISPPFSKGGRCFPTEGSPCPANRASFGVIAGYGPGSVYGMTIETFTPGGLDGIHELRLKVADGAGHVAEPWVQFVVLTDPRDVTATHGPCFLDVTASGDRTAPGDPCSQACRESSRHIAGIRELPTFVRETGTDNYWGQVWFTPSGVGESCRATWEVVIDDNDLVPRGPCLLICDAPFDESHFVTKGARRDWVSTGTYTSIQDYASARYNPSDLSDPQHLTKRGGLQLDTRVYDVRLKLWSDVGSVRTTYTTFLIDNEPPFMVPQGTSGIVVRRDDGDAQQYEPAEMVPLSAGVNLQVLIQANLSGVLKDYLEFGGSCQDDPHRCIDCRWAEGVVGKAEWKLERWTPQPDWAKTDPAGKWSNVVPASDSFALCFDGKPPRCPANSVQFGALAQPLFPDNPMRLEPIQAGKDPWEHDGRWRITVRAVDGAGWVTQSAAEFGINLDPPRIERVTISNTVGATDTVSKAIAFSEGPAAQTRVDGRVLRFVPYAKDEFPIKEVWYCVAPSGANPPGPEPPDLTFSILTISPTATEPVIPEVSVLTDTAGTALTVNTTYTLWVKAVEEVPAGNSYSARSSARSFRTTFTIEEHTDLAVFAPLDARSKRVKGRSALATARTWLTSSEQATIATTLEQLLPEYRPRTYDLSGCAPAEGHQALDRWLVQNTGDGPADVLVLLDAAPLAGMQPASNPLLRQFLESQDGNCIIWVGPEPFSNRIAYSASDCADTTLGGPLKSSVARAIAQSDVFRVDLGMDLASASASSVQSLYPPGGAQFFLPSLHDYKPTTDYPSPPGTPPNRWLRSGPHDVGSGVDPWDLERLFTTEITELSPPRGNCFVYRHSTYRSRFASFQAFGDLSLSADRPAVPELARVLCEFIRNYALAGEDPLAAASRITFSNASTDDFLTPSATSAPRDLVRAPDSSAGFSNLTINTTATQSVEVVDISADARTITFLSQGRLACPTQSAFSWENGAIRLLARALTATAPIVSASRAASGGLAAVETRSDLSGVNGGTNLTAAGIFTVGSSSAPLPPPATLITSAFALGDSGQPHVSADGHAIVFASRSLYDKPDIGSPPGTRGLGGRGIFRYQVGGGADAYLRGWVSGALSKTAECSHPAVAGSGRFVVFQASGVSYPSGRPEAVAHDQIFLAEDSGSVWNIGAITQGATPSTAPAVVEPAALSGPYPSIVFVSKANFHNVKPSSASITASGQLSSVVGAREPGLLPHEAVYLFRGDFSKGLVLVACAADAACLNPRLSPDGAEIVFESQASSLNPSGLVTGFTPPRWSQVINPSGPRNRIYRYRVDTGALQRITPESVDVGPGARPVVSQ